jgi:hypothetical protein
MGQKIDDKTGKVIPFPGQKQQVQGINVNLTELSDLKCACGKGDVFVSVNRYKILPSLLSPTGKPALIPIGCIQCIECKAVYTMEQVMEFIQK